MERSKCQTVISKSPRRNRSIHGVSADDKDYLEVVAEAGLKLDCDKVLALRDSDRINRHLRSRNGRRKSNIFTWRSHLWKNGHVVIVHGGSSPRADTDSGCCEKTRGQSCSQIRVGLVEETICLV